MHLISVECFCVILFVLKVRSQGVWNSYNNDYNSGYSGSWNSGFSNRENPGRRVSNGKNSNNFGNAGFVNSFTTNNGNKFGTSNSRPNTGFYQSENSNWGYETATESIKVNSNKKNSNNRFPNEKLISSVNANSAKWNENSNNFYSNANENTWGSKKVESSNNQNWNSNFEDVLTDSDYEDNSVFSSWGSQNNKKTTTTTTSSYDNSFNRETTTKRKGLSDSSYNKKSKKPSENNIDESQRNKTQTNPNNQNQKKQSNLDLSILDELDKNDWYFGKESNYPKPPFKTSLNIDVSELWNFDRRNKPKQNFQNNNNRNTGNSRRNRQIMLPSERENRINCVCVNIKFCAEEDMIITQKDIQYDSRNLEEFICEDVTDVCCTNPKIPEAPVTRTLNQESQQLQCGQRKIRKNAVQQFEDGIAEPGEFPWLLDFENSEVNCSATLIHSKVALTAAHCVIGFSPYELILKSGIWSSDDNEPPQTRKVTNIIVHPDFSMQNPRNDIALLVLETPFELTDNVNPVCLPVTNDKWDSNQCVVAGWRPEEIHGQVLEKGVVDFLPEADCQNIMLVTDLWRNYILHDSFVCGWEKTGKQSCKGDEGGFVICPSKRQPNTYLQIGIVSKGINCDKFGRPGIFTNVLKFLDWINKNSFELGLFDDIDVRTV